MGTNDPAGIVLEVLQGTMKESERAEDPWGISSPLPVEDMAQEETEEYGK